MADGILQNVAASVRKVGSRHFVRLHVPETVLIIDPDNTAALADQLHALALDAVRADSTRRSS